jgi:hypothetical protein
MEFENSLPTAALMRPAVSVSHRCSPASIASASRAILLGYISLAGRFPLEARRRLRKRADVSKETESLEHCLLRLVRLQKP